MSAPLPATYLFVPGDRPERFAKAIDAGADAVIVDLEDAVAPANKPAARDACARLWAGGPIATPLLVRINDAESPYFDDDLSLLKSSGIEGVMLSKTESAKQIARVSAMLGPKGYVIALVETARGVANASEIAQGHKVQRLAFGTLDYAIDLDLSGDERGLLYPSCQLAIASRAAGIGSPVAGVTTDLNDETRLLADFALARACGFGAKLCIHPRQIAPLRRALEPTPGEVEWARRVLAALESGQAAVQVDGKMVDRPVMLKAQGILRRIKYREIHHS
jgi:citrate lyase subunit beta/citryl-CoA lyase